MKTTFIWISNAWRRAKNHCRTTDNKDATAIDPTPVFRRKLLISEHSPIRLLEFDWQWKGIPYWVSTEWSRHKFEKFISTQRNDRTRDPVPRGQKPQDAPVDFDGYANMQNLIDAWRKRLCRKATREARHLAEDFKIVLATADCQDEADMLVPNCVYRMGCPEFTSCGLLERFTEYANARGSRRWVTDISERYRLYRQFLLDDLEARKRRGYEKPEEGELHES